MGATNSKVEEDQTLRLCRERRRFVKQALDGRLSLAAAHVSYVESLRDIGILLRKFLEPEAPTDSSLFTSISATPEPITVPDKSISQNSDSSSLSPSCQSEAEDSFSIPISPLPAPIFHVKHMKSGGTNFITVEEEPPVTVTATFCTSSASSVHAPSPPPGTPPWDYFDLSHPIDNKLAFHEGVSLNRDFGRANDVNHHREVEDVPELYVGAEKSFTSDGDSFDSEDNFDESPSEPIVQMYENRNVAVERQSTSKTSSIQAEEELASEFASQNGEKELLKTNEILEIARSRDTIDTTRSGNTGSYAAVRNGNATEVGKKTKPGTKDLVTCMKDIEILFLRASEAGKEVPKMLEAEKVQLQPLSYEKAASKSKTYAFLTACLSCYKEEIPHPEASAATDVKYLTWHKSISSISSSSGIRISTVWKDDAEDPGNSLFSGIFMNSGGHASTLDRLYAWERKLYDEVKASVAFRKKYDMKRRLLSELESRGEALEATNTVDKNRASIKDLHFRIRVSIHRINSISKIIEDLRDKEIQPQLEELIKGLCQMWARMLDCHKHQCRIISLAGNGGNAKVSIQSENHYQIALLLGSKLNKMSSSIAKWIQAHKFYLNAINGWILKCVNPLKQQKSSRRKQQPFSPRRSLAPPIFVTCRDWLLMLDELPVKDLEESVKDLAVTTSHVVPRHDQDRGRSNASFSVSRNAGKSDGKLDRNASHVGWILKYDNLQLSLTFFLEQLKMFADTALMKYEILRMSVDDARIAYEGKVS